MRMRMVWLPIYSAVRRWGSRGDAVRSIAPPPQWGKSGGKPGVSGEAHHNPVNKGGLNGEEAKTVDRRSSSIRRATTNKYTNYLRKSHPRPSSLWNFQKRSDIFTETNGGWVLSITTDNEWRWYPCALQYHRHWKWRKAATWATGCSPKLSWNGQKNHQILWSTY